VTAPGHWKVISNAVIERSEPADAGAKTHHFARSVRMSTYITAVCAGPYVEVREEHDGIDLGVFVRASMKQYLDADDILLITRQGFDFFHEKFALRYPLPKYDQVYVPEFNAGAMENFGCIVHGEQYYIFRSQVTDFEYENRANTILHEMAHMWFGDLVTMRWWDDLWLNESFAEWASHWANTEATRFTDAWTTFQVGRKSRGYRQDQLSSTHPVYCEMPDVEAVEVNFDMITYAKGASVIKQLIAYVGIDPFVAGLRTYFRRHAWGNATFADLLSAVEEASGRKLSTFATEWLETAQVNTLRPVLSIGPDGSYSSVVVEQEAPAGYPTLRTHRIAIGLYDLVGDRLVRRDRVEVDVAGPSTTVDALAGLPAADVLLLNDEDLTYAKLRLDERSLSTVVEHIAGFDNSLARALCWSAAWDMVRDGEMPARQFVALICSGLPTEGDVNLVVNVLAQAQGALTYYADPTWAPTGWASLNAAAHEALAAAAPGSGLQLAWARAFTSSARSGAQLSTLRAWLDGVDVPAGLVIGTELRWSLVQALTAGGAAGAVEIQSELDNDRTAGGERQAAVATALIGNAEAKAEVWRRITGPVPLSNWEQRALLIGFQHSAQTELTAPFVERYFAVIDEIWATRDSELAQEFVEAAYPTLQVSQRTLAASDEWLALPDRPAPLRRLVAEGRDGVARALAARARDAAEG
jgi:aminopeptidase N